ncbi:uncharacterized protein LOC115621536 [Scaptodrosophila lebanonensis]|uniref:Uncharacterized protein LOC115621536 n=1 Tax=Drosophila lebanonensis TaxID=7225 RepID=A0A6J2T7Y7_DROLE|nr:uncharacterized protein LOC115621536 [Scaptodrosophila lebanonensis]
MFELEEYSSSIHEGFFSKYADAAGPSLDCYVSDSMQDMLDVDIRAEIANVVGSPSDLTSSLDHALEAISAINNNNNNNNAPSTHNANANLLASSALHASPTAKWMGSCANFWSTSDYFADVGACVNPISVMPLINSSSLLLYSPQKSKTLVTQSSSSTHNGSSAMVLASPCDPHKSHLTFSPAQMKVSAGSMRREQVSSHIPKQISVPISSTLTGAGTTAPATMATNSALQRRSTSVDTVRKDLAPELRKVQSAGVISNDNNSVMDNKTKAGLLGSNGVTTNTIKLAPGIGGLTFANSATYNKLKQQTSVKSPSGSPVTAQGNIVLKRDRESSPLHNMTTLHANGVAKRNLLQQSAVASPYSSTPKSIASAAHSPHHQMQIGNNSSVGSPSSMGRPSTSSSPLSFSGTITPLSNTSNLVNIANNNGSGGVLAVKPLQQKIKLPAVDSAFPKPAYSYSCLIALALKNSRAGSLPVSEIYSFLCQHFPYFEKAPTGWKNSVRHNLSLNKCFEKIERPVTNGNQRKGCRWAMNPERITKMDEEVHKWSLKDPAAIRDAMVYPEHLEALERGEMKHGSADSDVELDSQSEIEETSDLEEADFDETLVDAMLVEEDDDLEEDEEEEEELHGYEHIEPHHSATRELQSAMFYEKVDDLYHAIDIDEDNKEAVRRAIANDQGTHIIELNPADLNANANDGYQSPKRARLDINYTIGPAGDLQQQYGQKVKVQPVLQASQSLLPVAQQQQQQQQHQHQQLQQPTYNRRKMPLVNRII